MKSPILIIAGCIGLGLAACDKDRQLPPTELPQLPKSATLPCEELTDKEIIQCLQNPDTREICRKLDTTCARYKDLQSFVSRAWAARDKK